MAELELFHSRPIAPTRRIAPGVRNLPTDPAPGAGGLLLAGIVADNADRIDGELREDLVVLIEDLAVGRRTPQPKVRHRYQSDHIGLLRSVHRLIAEGDDITFQFETELGRPIQHVLAAVYACGSLPLEARTPVFDAIGLALLWQGEVDNRFVSQVMGGRKASMAELMSWNDPKAWALGILGFEDESAVDLGNRAVQRRFRSLLREAHPDHGGGGDDAAQRIADLTEARRILSN